MELIIEEVSRSRKLLQRHKIQGPRIAIGRAFDNDIILSDPYVCPQHILLTVNQEGRWLISDHGSVNGSFIENEAKLNHPRPIRSGEVIAIGKSFLRFVYPDHPVAPAIRLSGIEGVLNWLSTPLMVFSVIFLYLAILMSSYYMSASTDIKTSQMVSTVFAKFAAASFLPLFFALLARFFKHDARVLTQLVVWYSFFIVFLVIDGIGTLLSFNSNSTDIATVMVQMAELLLVFLLLWSTFYIAFHQSGLRRTMMAGGLTLAMTALIYLYNASHSVDFRATPKYNNTLLAPEFAFSEPVSVEQFIRQSEEIFDLATKKAVDAKND